MNKIYTEPIIKANMLIDGVEKQGTQLRKKGISTDTAQLAEACREMQAAGERQEAIEAELKAARDDAHKKMEKLKELYTEFKTPIKQNFAPELWHVFGIPDKK